MLYSDLLNFAYVLLLAAYKSSGLLDFPMLTKIVTKIIRDTTTNHGKLCWLYTNFRWYPSGMLPITSIQTKQISHRHPYCHDIETVNVIEHSIAT